MSEITPLREAVENLADRTASPDFSDLKRRATRRGRQRVVMIATATAAVIVGSAFAFTGGLDNNRRTDPVDQPTPSPTVQESAEPQASLEELGQKLSTLLELVPGWTVTRPANYPDDYDYAFNGPCSRDWDEGAISGGDGGIFGTSLDVGHGKAGFPSEARASTAAAEFVKNLASCKKTEWRTQPIPQTGAVLASSDHAVAWIQEGHGEVHVLQATTTDGPPPRGVQVAVAEWLVAYITEMNTD